MATAPFYLDGDWTTAAAAGNVRFEQPFAGDKNDYVLVQDFMQFTANFTPLALNTAHPVYTTYFLVAESELQDTGGGISRWTRKYAQVPQPRNDYLSYAYSFIGYFGKIANLVTSSTFPVLGRNRLQLTVPCRSLNEYFIWIDGNTIKDSTGTNIYTGTPGQATPESIPVILGQRYYVPAGTVPSPGVFVATYPAGSPQDIAYGTAQDYIWDAPAFGGVIPTIPSRTTYQTLINNGTEIVAEDSQVSRWLGNIYLRVTKYILPR